MPRTSKFGHLCGAVHLKDGSILLGSTDGQGHFKIMRLADNRWKTIENVALRGWTNAGDYVLTSSAD